MLSHTAWKEGADRGCIRQAARGAMIKASCSLQNAQVMSSVSTGYQMRSCWKPCKCRQTYERLGYLPGRQDNECEEKVQGERFRREKHTGESVTAWPLQGGGAGKVIGMRVIVQRRCPEYCFICRHLGPPTTSSPLTCPLGSRSISLTMPGDLRCLSAI